MNQKRFVIAAVTIVGVIVLLMLWSHWRSDAVQVPLTFERIAAAIHRGEADHLVRQIHADYDFKANWPGRFDDPAFDRLSPRALVRHGLEDWFKAFDSNPIDCITEIERIESRDDGTAAAIISMRFVTKDGNAILTNEHPIAHQRFVLQRAGWLSAALYIKAHDQIQIHE